METVFVLSTFSFYTSVVVLALVCEPSGSGQGQDQVSKLSPIDGELAGVAPTIFPCVKSKDGDETASGKCDCDQRVGGDRPEHHRGRSL